MSEKRKISFRKILQTLLTLVLGVGCTVAILSAARMQDAKKLTGLKINIRNSQYHFVDEAQIKGILLANKDMNVTGTNIGHLNVHKIEESMLKNPWVERSQVYIDNQKVMHIYVTQRVPVARLFDQGGNSYYLDRQLKSMPLSDKYTHYTTVVTNVPVLKDDSAGNALKAEIVEVVKHIDKDSFWGAQISQVIVNDDRNFELVPVLGNQKILLGDTARLDEKFDNLFAFYKKVLNRVGWDKYEVLDIRFAGQVVASPALPWKPPVDKAISNMNWVKSIIGKDSGSVESDTPTVVYVNKAILKDTVVKKAAVVTPKPVAPTVVTKPAPVPARVVSAPAHPAVKKQEVVKKTTVQATSKPKPKAKPAVKPVLHAKTVKPPPPKKKEPVKNNKAKETKKQAKEETKPKYIYQGSSNNH